MGLWQYAIISLIAMSALMTVMWYVQYRRRNAGIVDVAWAFGTGVNALWFSVLLDGAVERRLIVGLLSGLWAARLGVYLLRRILREREDGRYEALRTAWGNSAQWKLFAFFQVQASWAVLFALPMLAAAANPSAGLSFGDYAGAMVGLVGIIGESFADRQLAAFRSIPENHGRVCRYGLWKYSRHPNYFFEWLHWFAYTLLAYGGPYFWLAACGPVVMYLFLNYVTGIPPLEARALQTRGDAYRDYQQTTSRFFPLPPKRETHT